MTENHELTLNLKSGNTPVRFKNYDAVGNPMTVLDRPDNVTVYITYVWHDLPPENNPHYCAYASTEDGTALFNLEMHDKNLFEKALASIIDAIETPEPEPLTVTFTQSNEMRHVMTMNRPAALREVLDIVEKQSAGAESCSVVVFDQNDNLRGSIIKRLGRMPSPPPERTELACIIEKTVTRAQYAQMGQHFDWLIIVDDK